MKYFNHFYGLYFLTGTHTLKINVIITWWFTLAISCLFYRCCFFVLLFVYYSFFRIKPLLLVYHFKSFHFFLLQYFLWLVFLVVPLEIQYASKCKEVNFKLALTTSSGFNCGIIIYNILMCLHGICSVSWLHRLMIFTEQLPRVSNLFLKHFLATSLSLSSLSIFCLFFFLQFFISWKYRKA